jgi:hypothetical protein
MKSYKSSTPRITCAIAAIGMTAITMGLLVVLPSAMEPDSQTFVMLASAKSLTTTTCNAVDRPLCVDVVAGREPGTTAVRVVHADLKCKQ